MNSSSGFRTRTNVWTRSSLLFDQTPLFHSETRASVPDHIDSHYFWSDPPSRGGGWGSRRASLGDRHHRHTQIHLPRKPTHPLILFSATCMSNSPADSGRGTARPRAVRARSESCSSSIPARIESKTCLRIAWLRVLNASLNLSRPTNSSCWRKLTKRWSLSSTYSARIKQGRSDTRNLVGEFFSLLLTVQDSYKGLMSELPGDHTVESLFLSKQLGRQKNVVVTTFSSANTSS